MKRIFGGFWIATIMAVMLIVSACGSAAPNNTDSKTGAEQTAKPDATKTEQPADNKPVTITTNGIEMTYPEAPKRAVSLNQHVTEIMLALGLADKMVGTAYLDDQILPELKEAYDKVPVLSDKYPNKEVLMAANPDFVYSGWKSGFGDKGVGSMEDLEKAGIKSYLQESSNKPGPTVDDVFADIQNIGKIFRVEDKANEVIGKMKQEMDQTVSKLGNVDKPLQVFVYDSGEDNPFTAANNYMTSLIKMAGGKNVFDDIQKGWAEVSWEEVVNRKPDVIVVVDYGDKTVDQKKNLLLTKRELADIPAIQNKRLIILPLSAASEGVRAPIALKILAEGFYPDKFK
ncbi:lipoprotein [Brevibacillus reuszeri]|uniref:Fe3+-hydroxamate ABC transporter substrate-binding protein n=1 Tax=Brevibacillus reuszeri TaxID=54915 RepID=A0A0K9Z0Q4_9BACL|nr:ABC transporter substrate-binding protein [Brevibacillus reuszeri]KNB74045.1 Fe3+-hydroxamate ABC transporter substrate-binding protein [Brevibacillus reuszeri]MED1859780.1 ABC transporter substrate-binding protein [Brevibacillus reuszeri]GED72428.1 lipoprotein [Brevibacillus reuszeri]